jgi:uncharacterized membrane protein YphA (DoxX/SURF4 family)
VDWPPCGHAEEWGGSERLQAETRTVAIILLAGAIEVVTGMLVAVGIYTRIAAFIASGEMAVAYSWPMRPRIAGPRST